MTGRCRDFPGPAEPVIATSRGWVPLDEPADRLGVSRRHVIRLVNAGELDGCEQPDSSDWMIPLASVAAFEERADRADEMADELSRSLDALGAPLE